MKKYIVTAMAFAFMLAAASLAFAGGKGYYVCACGNDCKCNAVSAEPGKCGCGKDMAKMDLLAVEGGDALFCTCGGGCKCKLSEDKATCGCGKPVRKVSLKGKYVCACGAGCDCGAISDKPGKCGCDKPLKLVE